MLLSRKMDKAIKQGLIIFLKMYLPFSKKKESTLTFNKEINALTANTTTMGIKEQVLAFT